MIGLLCFVLAVLVSPFKSKLRRAIASFVYDVSEDILTERFLADFSQLLDAYDVLRQRIGPSIADAASPPTEDDFQEAATALSKPSKKGPYIPPPPGPVAPPAKSLYSKGAGFKRDPRVSGAAISDAGYLCEVDPAHVSFVCPYYEDEFRGSSSFGAITISKTFFSWPRCTREYRRALSDLPSQTSSWTAK